MKDLEANRYILGMDISRDWVHIKLWLSQSKYVDTILHRFKMQDYKLVNIPFSFGTKLILGMFPNFNNDIEEMLDVTYASVIGSLKYAIVCIRLDLAQVVGVLRNFMSNPSRGHWNFVKSVFRYFEDAFDYYLVYHVIDDVDKSPEIHGFVDANWVGTLDN